MNARGPRQAAILAMIKPGRYMRPTEIVAESGVDPRTIYQCLHWMVKIGMLHSLGAGSGSKRTRYYLTAEDAEANRADFELETALIKPSRRKTHPAKPKAPKMTKERKAFNKANDTPKACLPPQYLGPNRQPVNPDHRRMSFKAQWDAAEPHIPPGVTVQRLPGFERFGSPQAAKMARGA